MSGIGALLMLPLLGNLSDKFGRKTILTIPLLLTVIPLGWCRSTTHSPTFFLFLKLSFKLTLSSISFYINILTMFNFFFFIFYFVGILGYGRSTDFFYIYFVFKCVTSMVCEGSVQCLAVAYAVRNFSHVD